MTTEIEALDRIVRQACRGELVFPTNMAAALRLQRALDDPECHLDAAADLVLAEPLIAARLVAIANSVAYTRFGGHVSNVRTAVSLLGFKPLRSLVAVIVVRQLAEEIADPVLKRQAAELWRHSAHVAALAKVLAREFTDVDPETALFAGVVHEIDGFYLLSRTAEFPSLLEDAAASGRATRATLAGCILNTLKVPKLIAAAVESLYVATPALPPVTAGDVLSLANQLAANPSPLAGWDGSDAAKGEATDFRVGDKTLQELMAAHADEIEATTAALMA
ncbi:MAG: HDOD domain-containing protein [Pseudomonadota bacterium]